MDVYSGHFARRVNWKYVRKSGKLRSGSPKITKKFDLKSNFLNLLVNKLLYMSSKLLCSFHWQTKTRPFGINTIFKGQSNSLTWNREQNPECNR